MSQIDGYEGNDDVFKVKKFWICISSSLASNLLSKGS